MSTFKLILHLMTGLLFISNSSGVRGSVPNHQHPAKTIYVDKSGSGNYTSVQKAINSVPDNNTRWICIFIKSGTYYEMVKIPEAKQYIFLKGEGQEKTIIQYWGIGSSIHAGTFQLYADNFAATDITFKNSYNFGIANTNDPRITWNPAAVIVGDKATFYRCGFHGIQDTIGDIQGRHYFRNCFISGAIDFIWGAGRSVYRECLMKTVASYVGGPGYVTAQGRESPDDPSAFVFMFGTVTGEGQTYLGRAYRQYSTVLFYNTYMTDVVLPLGWSAWNAQAHENDITYAEVGCKGGGAKVTGRVNWMKNLTTQELDHYISDSFNNQDGWIDRQPWY